MRILHTSDIHLDEHNRLQETLKVLQWLSEEAHAIQPDAIFICGDSAPVSVRPMTPLERNTLADFYVRLAETAPVFVVRGNHDLAEHDVDIFSRLKCLHGVHAFSQPGTVRGVTRDRKPFIVGALPYPSKGNLMVRAKTDGVKLEDVNEACRQAMRAVLMGIKYEMNNDQCTRLLLTHINVTGARVGGFALVGQDVEVGAQDLEDTGADYIACGHIHQMQQMSPRVWYCGSPRRVDFGEEAEEKGYLFVDVQAGEIPVVQFRSAPLRSMQTIRATVSEFGVVHDSIVTPGADVRLIIEVDEERRSTLDEQQIRDLVLADTAHAFKVEYRVTPKQRVRAPEIREGRTDADRLRAWLGTLSPVPDDATMGRLLLKLEQLTGRAA